METLQEFFNSCFNCILVDNCQTYARRDTNWERRYKDPECVTDITKVDKNSLFEVRENGKYLVPKYYKEETNKNRMDLFLEKPKIKYDEDLDLWKITIVTQIDEDYHENLSCYFTSLTMLIEWLKE